MLPSKENTLNRNSNINNFGDTELQRAMSIPKSKGKENQGDKKNTNLGMD